MSTTDCECCYFIIYFLFQVICIYHIIVCVCLGGACVCTHVRLFPKMQVLRADVLLRLQMNTSIFLQVTNRIITLLICNFFWLLCRQNPQDNSLNKDKIWYLGVHMNVYFAWCRKNVKVLSNLHCRNMKYYLFSEIFCLIY